MKTDVLVIGAGPAGVVAALTAKKYNPEKKVVIVREKENGIIPCAIPYIFRRLDSVEKIIMPDTPLKNNGIQIVIAKAKEIDKENKKVIFENFEEIEYDKLILATGSRPVKLPIEGADKKGVWYIEKDFEYLKKFREYVLSSQKILIIGGGFIGVELAEELSKIGKDVSIVEKSPHCLFSSFDEEFCAEIENELNKNGVKLFTNTLVEKITGNEKAEGAILSNGTKLEVDCVIIAAGASPNSELAKNSGIKIGNKGGIIVDEYMRTTEKDIYAIGDCAETRDFFTGKPFPIMLASTATSEARIAASNLYGIKVLRENKGTLGSFSTIIYDKLFACTGYTERRAREEGFEIVTGVVSSPSTHPSDLGGAEVKVKLIFLKKEGTLLGAQISGPKKAAELVNMLALAIQNEVSAYDFDTLQISTHPLLTPAPTVYPVIKAAQEALAKM